jgi:membrane protease YdiL (CAAX protease family)
VTSAVFGVLHAYQGAIGMLRAGTMGAVLAWGLLASGSLWPPLVAHVVIDLLAGLVLADRLMVPAGAGGVEGSEGPSGRPDHPPTAR